MISPKNPTDVRDPVDSAATPRTLIFVQAVDPADPVFGFFVTWLNCFATYGQAIVGALRVGADLKLPSSIEIRSLRARGVSRLAVLRAVLTLSWQERKRYEAVFVRGDAIYLVIAGWLWRLLGKKVIFWYTHYQAKSPLFWLGSLFAHEVVTAVPESNPLRRALPIGHHIDLEPFRALVSTHTRSHTRMRFLIVGRISAVKRVPWLIELVKEACKDRPFQLTIVGPAPSEQEAKELRACLDERVTWIEQGASYDEIKKYYAEADVVLSATTGSLDKTIVEAAAAGCLILATTPALARGLSSELAWIAVSNRQSFVEGIKRVLALSDADWKRAQTALAEWSEQHGQEQHLEALTSLLQEQAPPPPRFRTRLKRWYWSCFPRVGVFGVPVLMFHAFDGRGSSSWDVIRLRALATRLRIKGIKTVSLSDASQCLQGVAKQASTVAWTIDDATDDLLRTKSFFEQHQLPATIFAPAKLDLLQNSEGISRRILSGSELIGLMSGTCLEIGGHGATHRSYPTLSLEEARTETETSFVYTEMLNKTGGKNYFAYPRGKYRAEHIPLIQAAGFAGALTVKPGTWLAATPSFEIPRLPIMSWMTSADVMHLLGYHA